MSATKKSFASHLQSGLLKHYRGRMPSFNVIARDFSLRAPDLLPVSRETIRHWLRGESMPHMTRMQVLIDWLGAELIDYSSQCNRECRQEGVNKSCVEERIALCNMFEKLDRQETRAMMAVLNMLVAKHDANSLAEKDS